MKAQAVHNLATAQPNDNSTMATTFGRALPWPFSYPAAMVLSAPSPLLEINLMRLRFHVRRVWLALVLASILSLPIGAGTANAQTAHAERLPSGILDAAAPADRIAGEPGALRVANGACRSLPLGSARRRIVDIAAQEWAYFGFSVTDRIEQPLSDRGSWSAHSFFRSRRWRSPVEQQRRAEAFARVEPSIAGYWAATPAGSWMIQRHNSRTNSDGTVSRWRDPWSAAFVSWVQCEAGLGEPSRFKRSIAHREYIDQAIQARDGKAPATAYVAYDLGESTIGPGDLLCSGSRAGYKTIDDRRQKIGQGARTHCDIVVSVKEQAGEILAIGGNVYGTVSLKRLPAVRDKGETLRPDGNFFAHMSLRADAIAPKALSTSPTIRALACDTDFKTPSQLDVLGLQLIGGGCAGGAVNAPSEAGS